jgi:SAM-dependent methyltransferase
MHSLKIRFDVCRAGQVSYAPQSFDIVFGFGILHHLHQDLPAIFAEVTRLLKPTGTAVFVEPIAYFRAFCWLRPLVPVERYASADERQLTQQDFAALPQYFQHLEFRYFWNLERLTRLGFGQWNCKLRQIDYRLQRKFPALRKLYGEAAIIARK